MNAEDHVCAGGFDWVGVFCAMQARSEGARAPRMPGEDRWQRRAARFDRSGGAPADLPAVLADQLRGTDEVLDIGAGTGRDTVLFARRCRRVIAVEPSAAMRACLTRRVREEGLTNVEIVDAAWPDAGGLAADVVFSSHVLYGIEDPVGFIAAMNAATRRLCALQLGLRPPGSALDRLRHELHGSAPPPRPAALEVLNMLHQLGLAASMAVVAGSERVCALRPDDDEMIDVCARLAVDPSRENVSRVRAALAALVPPDAAGSHALGKTAPNAIIWWAPP